MSTVLINGPDFEALAVELLEQGAHLRFQASGSSMAPFIANGDWLEVVPVALSQVRRGMVVLCRLGQGPAAHLVAHRVWRRRRAGGRPRFYVGGDANHRPDGWVPGPAVLGRVQWIERGGRRWRTDAPLYRVGVWLWVLPGVRRVYRKLQAVTFL